MGIPFRTGLLIMVLLIADGLLIFMVTGNSDQQLAMLSKHGAGSWKPPQKLTLTETNQYIEIQQFISYRAFHFFMDSLANVRLPKVLTVPGELIIVNSNPWVLDTLRSKDYDRALQRGRFIDDLDSELILRPGDRLFIPDSVHCVAIAQSLLETRLVLNIPEFRLRVIRRNDTILACPVRVGRNELVFLEAVGRIVDLRTPVGKGTIIQAIRRPTSVNLKTGEVYLQTKRDDGRITKMPAIPSLEPEINGHRNGKMIHATTNPATLGRAYSHGCVGVSESDMWTIFYAVPVGAQVEFRYDLLCGTNTLEDIYRIKTPKNN